MAEFELDIRRLMLPDSVAVVGASKNGMGAWLFDQLVDWKFPGPIYPVNPKYTTLRGLPCYPSLADLPDPPDLVAMAVSASRVNDTLEQAAEAGAGAAVVVASGFGEIGGEGLLLEQKIKATADRLGIVMNGPNNYGVASLHERKIITAGPMPSTMQAGDIALVFASGALTNSVGDAFVSRGVGLSHVITIGNEAQVGLADYISYLATNEHAKVIACFVEGFRDPAAFERSARLVAKNGKRLVLVKTGRSELSRRAALAHTGALVGADSAVDAWLRKLGVARVKDLDELVETAILLGRYPQFEAGNIGLASISGGGSGILADVAADTGLQLEAFSDETTTKLQGCLPDAATPNNPLDVTTFGLAEDSRYNILRTLCEDPDLTLVSWAFHSPTVADDLNRGIYASMIESLGKASKSGVDKSAVAFSMVGGTMDPAFVKIARDYDLPLLQGARNALAAFAAAQNSSRWIKWLADSDDIAGPAPEGLLDAFRAKPGTVVSERAMTELLGTVGLPVTRQGLARDENEAARVFADLGGVPVALKVDSADVPHKAAVGGVALGVTTEAAVRAAYREIMTAVQKSVPLAKIDGVLVQEMAADGIDVFLGCTIEPGIGPILALGQGGVLVEALDNISTALAPLAPEEARAFVESSPAATILRARRGGTAGDLNALIDVVEKISHLAWWLRDDLDEFDVNPVRVFPEGQGARILDALAAKKSGGQPS
ncbi:acetate--CoA ligase family protein [Rhodococcus sp. NPDC059968]|uniref:acetate--CoA ligase family protein n=1 Tax=Rhodococcus sp. NPDC059968 TaxID=3347017 RepID=UPI0036717517